MRNPSEIGTCRVSARHGPLEGILIRADLDSAVCVLTQRCHEFGGTATPWSTARAPDLSHALRGLQRIQPRVVARPHGDRRLHSHEAGPIKALQMARFFSLCPRRLPLSGRSSGPLHRSRLMRIRDYPDPARLHIGGSAIPWHIARAPSSARHQGLRRPHCPIARAHAALGLHL